MSICYSVAVTKNGVDGVDAKVIETIAKKHEFKIQYEVANGWDEVQRMVGILHS